MRKFKVRTFYSSFCSYEVEAENEDEAVLKARNLEIDQNEIMLQLEPFKEADEAEILERDKNEC